MARLAFFAILACGALTFGVSQSATTRIDRVGYPKDYRTRFRVIGVDVRAEAPEVLTAYANELVPSATASAPRPFPDGAIIVMEFAYALRDEQGNIVRDANGNVKTGAIEHVDVMKRGKDWGQAYGSSRSGNWEYAGYRLDGSYTTAPEGSAKCAACHLKAGPALDFVFPMSLPEHDRKESTRP